jgi:hypothetical protein
LPSDPSNEAPGRSGATARTVIVETVSEQAHCAPGVTVVATASGAVDWGPAARLHGDDARGATAKSRPSTIAQGPMVPGDRSRRMR